MLTLFINSLDFSKIIYILYNIRNDKPYEYKFFKGGSYDNFKIIKSFKKSFKTNGYCFIDSRV